MGLPQLKNVESEVTAASTNRSVTQSTGWGKRNTVNVRSPRRWGYSQSTISQEVNRNRGAREYRPKQAEEKAQKRLEEKSTGTSQRGAMVTEVRERLIRKHSPEQVSGALRPEAGKDTSRTSIYNYIRADKEAGGELHKNLRINGKRRYPHRNKASRRKLPARVDISERPEIVNQRTRYGDGEADLIQGSRGIC